MKEYEMCCGTTCDKQKVASYIEQLEKLIEKHGICKKCGELFNHDIEEPFADCKCRTSEWYTFTPFMNLQKAHAETKAERDALAAQVEALQVHRKELLDLIYNCAIGQVSMGYVVDAESLAQSAYSITGVDAASNRKHDVETPQHHLRELRAVVMLDAVKVGRSQTKYFLRSSEDILQQIEQYADSVLKGEVE